MVSYILPFEKPLLELQRQVEALRAQVAPPGVPGPELAARIAAKEAELVAARDAVYAALTPWQKVLVARHPLRPSAGELVRLLCDDFFELHGDRHFADDRAILGGFATLSGRRVMLVGTRKGRDTKSNLECNFGCPFPEGYRKALRLMKLAAKFSIPVVTLVDTPGAFPGIEGEERHVAEAIAVNLREMFSLPVPVVCAVIGEGGSGGALGIGVADRILVFQYAYYSVISPEGCAAILWKDRAMAETASAALRLTAPDLLELGIADAVLPEPPGGAHTDPAATAATLGKAVLAALDELSALPVPDLLAARYAKYRAMGVFETAPLPPPLPGAAAGA